MKRIKQWCDIYIIVPARTSPPVRKTQSLEPVEFTANISPDADPKYIVPLESIVAGERILFVVFLLGFTLYNHFSSEVLTPEKAVDDPELSRLRLNNGHIESEWFWTIIPETLSSDLSAFIGTNSDTIWSDCIRLKLISATTKSSINITMMIPKM